MNLDTQGKDLIADRFFSNAAAVYISAVTGFELTLKQAGGKLTLPATADEWLHSVLRKHRVEVLPLDLAVCLKAAVLPPFHRDPCDRFIIATALLQRMPVVTVDRNFGQYGVQILD